MKAYKVILVIILLLVFVTANIILFARFVKLGNEPLYAILFLAGINLNLLALLTLIFYVGKNILRLFIDKKRNIPGHRFQIQLMSIFIILTLIPGLFLFIVGSGLVTGYIEKWLNPQGLASLEDAIKIAKLYYEEKRSVLRSKAKEIERYYTTKGVLILPSAQTIQEDLEIEWHVIDKPVDDLTKEAHLKGEATEVAKMPGGEYVRIAILLNRTNKNVILIGSTKIPEAITETVDNLKKDYEELSLKLKWRFPLKINFVLNFGFFTLLIIMLALWTSLKISKRITEPVKDLTEATMEVASGNLDVRINPEDGRKDEISYLIENFNIMIEQLKDGKLRLQEAYQDAEAQRIRLSSILENIHTGVIFIDNSGTVVSMNRASERILSLDSADFIGKPYRAILEYLRSEELENLIKGIRVKDLRGIERQIWLNIKDRPVTLRVFITALKMLQLVIGANGHSPLFSPPNTDTAGLIVVFDDITEIVNAQRAIAWQEIASRIAHEVKNPLTPIQLSTERLIRKWQNKDSDFDEVFMSSAKAIIKEVESLRKLVSDFSQFGKMPQIKKRIVDMREILKEVYYLYSGFKDISISLEMPEDEVFAEVDPEQLKRVFINIMDNAIEAINNSGQPKGDIHISLFAICGKSSGETEWITVSIADNGPGIPDEIKDKLFMPHFTTKKGGSGLGLAIANRIVAEHRGIIRIKDNAPRGSIFLIELPVIDGTGKS